MRAKSLLVAAVVIAVVACILLTQDPSATTTSDAPIERSEDSRPASTDAERAPDTRPGGIVTQPFAAGEKSVEALPAAADGIDVLVVHEESHRPAAGAVVGYVDRSRIDMKEVYGRNDHFDVEAAIDAHGAKYRTDENGRTRVPRGSSVVVVCARTATHFGLTHVQVGMDEATIVLAPREQLTVEVVDQESNPVPGATVGIVLLGGSDIAKGASHLWSAKTDARGRAHVGLESVTQWVRDFGKVRLAAVLKVPAGTIAHAPILRGKRAQTVRLTMPAYGSLRVAIKGPGGGAFKGPVAVTVVLPDDRFERRFSGLTRWFFAVPVARGFTDDGSVIIPHVGVGSKLGVIVDDLAEVMENARCTVDGPRAPGGRAEAVVNLTTRVPVLSGRIVDEAGRPVARRRFRVASTPGNHVSGTGDDALTTDASGRFQYRVHGKIQPRAVLTLTSVLQAASVWNGLHQEVSVEVRNLGAEGRDLGDLVLADLPLAVAGQVVDETGQPIGGAAVWLRPEGPRGHFMRTAETGTDSKGRFRIFGDHDAGRLRVFAHHHMHAMAGETERTGTRYVPGQEDLVITLARSGTLEGTLLLDHGIPDWEVMISGGGRKTRAGRKGRFHLTGITDDRVDVSVSASPDTRSTITIKDVSVQRSASIRAPRLQGIDLRGRIHTLSVTVLDGERRPIQSAYVRLHGGNKDPRFKAGYGGPTDAKGRWTVHSSHDSATVTVSKKGYANQVVTLSPQRAACTLEKQ